MTAQAQRTPSPDVLDRVLRDFEACVARLPEHVASRSARRRAADQLRELGWPSVRDEQWRYLRLRAFTQIERFAPAALERASGTPPLLPPELQSSLPPPLPGFQRLVWLDGMRVTGALSDGAIGASSQSAQTTGAVQLPLRGLDPAWLPEQRLALLTDMFAQDAAVLRIHGEAAIELLFATGGAARGGAVYPRLQIELTAGSRLTLIERHLGANEGAALVCASAAIELARGAQLDHYRLQQCGPDALVCNTLAARLHEEASYRVWQLQVGGGVCRNSARVRLAGSGAAVNWQAIAIGHGDQVHDDVLRIEHAAARTRTQELYRAIAEERARLAFNAHILIEPTAQGADARQSLRGLIEGNGEVDLRPRLEIHTDEVSAQHGATTGRLDENLLFYLLSRGIEPATARTLLKWAFLNDVLRHIELPQLRAEAERSAAGQLQDVLAVGALA